jgi:biopolymer transport protein ExbD
MARIKTEDAQLDMTPMIDVVFQLIIFFIVTIKMDDQLNEDIVLEDSKNGEILKEIDPLTVIIEVDQRGYMTMRNTPLKSQQLLRMLRNKNTKYGQFPILIRADWRTRHKDVKKVMDICTMAGLWRINFAAVMEHKRTGGWHQGLPGR